MKYIRISNIKLHIDAEVDVVYQKAFKVAGITHKDVQKKQIERCSIDARNKQEIRKIYSVGLWVKNYTKKNKNVTVYDKEPRYHFDATGQRQMLHRPVVVGFGPAGMFCAYMLAKYGYRPIVIERGSKVTERLQKIEQFWKNGTLDTSCNVQFGEGGAGTFSDGKLNTGIKDKQHRTRLVLETFVGFGAKENILYDAKPHVGTDILANVVFNMRQEIESLGGQFYFDTTVTDLVIEDGNLKGVVVNDGERIDTDICVLAIGHSARDTFEMLYQKGIAMEQKPFAVGVRVEHLQSTINQSQYGFADNRLGAAPYKLAYTTSSGRGVYSFCMCPGGYVVNASSEEGGTVVNGMSYQARDSKNANSAIVVTVTPKDFPSSHPLSGVAFQRTMEEKAYAAGRGSIPVQLLGDFCAGKVTTAFGGITPQIKGQTHFADINTILPEDICGALKEGMQHFGSVIAGFGAEDVILSAVESRTSSPVRILRNEKMQSEVAGLFPAGEGAGYAGGITSAAIDGIKIFETIASVYKAFTPEGKDGKVC